MSVMYEGKDILISGFLYSKSFSDIVFNIAVIPTFSFVITVDIFESIDISAFDVGSTSSTKFSFSTFPTSFVPKKAFVVVNVLNAFKVFITSVLYSVSLFIAFSMFIFNFPSATGFVVSIVMLFAPFVERSNTIFPSSSGVKVLSAVSITASFAIIFITPSVPNILWKSACDIFTFLTYRLFAVVAIVLAFSSINVSLFAVIVSLSIKSA